MVAVRVPVRLARRVEPQQAIRVGLGAGLEAEADAVLAIPRQQLLVRWQAAWKTGREASQERDTAQARHAPSVYHAASLWSSRPLDSKSCSAGGLALLRRAIGSGWDHVASPELMAEPVKLRVPGRALPGRQGNARGALAASHRRLCRLVLQPVPGVGLAVRNLLRSGCSASKDRRHARIGIGAPCLALHILTGIPPRFRARLTVQTRAAFPGG